MENISQKRMIYKHIYYVYALYTVFACKHKCQLKTLKITSFLNYIHINYIKMHSAVQNFGFSMFLFICFANKKLIILVSTDILWQFRYFVTPNYKVFFLNFPFIKNLKKRTLSIQFFLQHQIRIKKIILKDHVTLKTGVMAAENSAVHHRKKWNIFKQ